MRIGKRGMFVLALFYAALVLSAVMEDADANNLLKNPGFEKLGEDGFPVEWTRDTAGYKGEWTAKIDPSFAHSGSVSVGISRTGPDAHPSFAAFYSQIVRAGGERKYTLYFWTRGKGRFDMTVYLYGSNKFLVPQEGVTGLNSGWIEIDSQEWQKHSVELTIPEEGVWSKTKDILAVSSFRVALHVKDGLVWFDDAGLYLSGSGPEEVKGYVEKGISDFLTISRMSASPRIDGVIENGEWSSASATTGFFSLDGSVSDRQTLAYIGYDDKNLYVAFYSLQSGKFRKGSLVSEFSQSEVFEIWLVPPANKYFQVLVGPSGEVREISQQDKAGWSSGLVYRSRDEDSGEVMAGSGQLTLDKRIWTGELAIPFKGLGVNPPRDGEVWRINFTRDFSVPKGSGRTSQDWTTWSPLVAFNDIGKFGQASFDSKAPTVQLERINNPATGNLSLLANAGSNIGCQALVVLAEEPRKDVINRIEKPDTSGKLIINEKIMVSGATDMEFFFAASDIVNNKLIQQKRIPFTAISAFAVKVVPLYFKNTIRIEVDLSRMADLPGQAHVEIGLYGRDESNPRIIERMEFDVVSEKKNLNIDISSLTPGEYLLRGTLKDGKGNVLAVTTEQLPVPEKPAWMGGSLGRTDEVPLPWKPVVVEGKKVSVTQRKYELADSGLPERMVSMDSEILAGPAKLCAVINGNPVELRFNELKLVENKQDHATWRISGGCKEFAVSGTLRLEFDGFAVWRIELSSKQERVLDNLFMEFPFLPESAYFVRGDSYKSATLVRDMYSQDENWPEVFTMRDRKPEEENSRSHSRTGWRWPEMFFNQIVVSDGRRGLALMTETDENIIGDRYVEFTRSENSTVMKVNLISKPYSLRKPLNYEYFYIAMPVKPEPSDPKRWRAGSLTGSYNASGYKTPEGKEFLDRYYAGLMFGQGLADMPYPGIEKKIHKSEIERFRAHGLYPVGNIWYQTACDITPEYSLYFPEWEAKPVFGWGGTGYGRVYHACHRTSFQDYAVEVVRWMVEDAGYYGIYSDSGPILCGNEVHGCGYADSGGERRSRSLNNLPGSGATDRDGERRPTLNLLATREFLKRVYNVLKSGGRDYPHYTHTGGHMALDSFVDVRTEGEEWGAGERPVMFKRLSPDHFRASYARNDSGIPFTFYTLPKEQPHATLRENLMMTLPHRVGFCLEAAMDVGIVPVWDLFEEWWTAAEFIPYWSASSPVTTSDPLRVLASTYLKKPEGKALVVIANWKFEPAKVGVSIDSGKLGFAPVSAKVLDPISKEEAVRKPADIVFEIPARDFRVLLLNK